MRALMLTNEYPPNDLRRCRRPRRVPEPRAGEADRRRGALVRRPGATRPIGCGSAATGGDDRRPPTSAAAGLRRLRRNVAMVADPVDADVVHCHTWYTHLGGILVKQAYGIPLVLTTALAGAAAPLEARAARRRLRRLGLGRADRASRWPTRSSPSPQGTREDVLRLFDVDRRAGPRHPQRHRPGPVPAGHRDGRARAARHRPEPCRTSCSSGGSRARRGSSTWCARSPSSTRTSASCSAPARRTRRRSRAEMEAGRRGGARSAGPDVDLDRGDGAARRRASSSTRTRPSSAAPRSTSRSGSSTWRRWRAARRSWRRAVGGIPEVVVDGETGLLVPIEQAGGRLRSSRSTRSASSATWRPRSTR